MNSEKKTQSNELKLTKEINERKLDALEKGLSSSLSAVNFIRDYISVLNLKYNNKNDPESLTEVMALLFSGGALMHIDSMLDDMRLSIDDALVEMIESRDTDNK
ncbi:hypothetical protein [Nicoliella lavandulae]|uniref:Uncharacterized protein n=1 Tax=Nicoliella lavandulae TaxID=3082954 RepID=A0ABU8SL59_9LACO